LTYKLSYTRVVTGTVKAIADCHVCAFHNGCLMHQ